MFTLFPALVQRLKALFLNDTAQELETEFISRSAARQAELLRLADRYDSEGLHSVAERLRKHVEEIVPEQPLAGVFSSLKHWEEPATELAAATLPTARTVVADQDKNRPLLSNGRHKHR